MSFTGGCCRTGTGEKLIPFGFSPDRHPGNDTNRPQVEHRHVVAADVGDIDVGDRGEPARGIHDHPMRTPARRIVEFLPVLAAAITVIRRLINTARSHRWDARPPPAGSMNQFAGRTLE